MLTFIENHLEYDGAIVRDHEIHRMINDIRQIVAVRFIVHRHEQCPEERTYGGILDNVLIKVFAVL